MKNLFLAVIGLFAFVVGYSQQEEGHLTQVWRINIVNPGVEYEWPVFKNSTFTANAGIGYDGSLMNVTEYAPNGFLYMIAPFLDLEYKKIYNQKKREEKGKNIEFNSGNYWGFRSLTRGKELSSNFIRTDNLDFSIGPVWGIQRSYDKFHLQFDIGPVIYFDTKGNSGFFPFMVQLNMGFNL